MKASTSLIFLLLFCFFFQASLTAQISIAPMSVFIDPESRSGVCLIKNPSDQPREITISFFFGYPATDEKGNLFMQKEDSAAAKYSLIPYLKAFPRKMILKPQEEQLVRLIVEHSPNLESGTYYTRMMVRSKSAVPPIEQKVQGDSIAAQIEVIVEQITAAIYQYGEQRTNIELMDTKSVMDSASLVLLASLRRVGNSPFWGSINVRVKDGQGNLVAESSELVAVYFDLVKKFSFEKMKFKPGSYTAEYYIDTHREDIPEARRISVKPIRHKFSFAVNNQ